MSKNVEVTIRLPKQFYDILSEYVSKHQYYENVEEFLREAARAHAEELNLFKSGRP
ncbi:MAG: hypothetical protein QXX34_06195 [Candidatus Bathyarchaeia archaeon]